jgi:uncharacterized protein (TIGR02147 family)
VVRSILEMFPGTGNHKWIAKNLNPRISPVLVRNSIKLMLKLGLIEKQKNGVFKVKDKIITSGQDTASLAVGHFHLEMMHLAEQALKEMPSSRRHITGLTLGISPKAYQTICREILAFQDKILQIAKDDPGSNGVYQLNFHFFPVSNSTIERPKP